MNKYYLYRHIRLDKNEPFYIGIGTKTVDNIKYGTYTRANTLDKRNNIWKKIINKTEYDVEILIESDDYQFIKEKEREFIKLYGRKDLETGCLANMTDGGDGTIGVVVSKKSRELRSKNSKGKKVSRESIEKRISTLNKNGGYRPSKETIRKISLSKSKPVIQYSLSGDFIKLWNSTIEASEQLYIPKYSICQCANYNNRNTFTAFNYIWIYQEDFINNKLEKFNIAIDRVKKGKIKRFIPDEIKNNILVEYNEKIKNIYGEKKKLIEKLSKKYKLNYSSIRAIVKIKYNIN